MDNLLPETEYVQLWSPVSLALNMDLLGDMQVENLADIEIINDVPVGGQHEQGSLLNVAEASPTGKHPSTDNFPGKYDFDFALGENKSGSIWNYSPDLNKLFIKMNNKIQIGFIYDTPENGQLYLRALPVFLDSDNFAKPVERCYQHRNPEDMINEGNVENANHLVWVNDDSAQYMFDVTSQRLSVRTPLGPKASGSDRVYKEFSFMCLNSCQRIKCPIAIVFTLEDENMRVLGRQIMNLKVCTGPNRDRKNEESAKEEKSSKKRKIDDSSDDVDDDEEDILTISVPKNIHTDVVRFAKYFILQLCEEEKRKLNADEDKCLKEYNEILRKN